MPKTKRKRVPETESTVLGEREVKKLRRLLRQTNEEENLVTKHSERYHEPKDLDSDSISQPSDHEDETIEKSLVSEPPIEHNEEWKKFFGVSKEDDGFIEDLQKNLTEARLKVAEEASQFSGSTFGDLEDFKGVDDIEELPEELVNHIRLLSDVLKHYRSGPLPKTVKMIPNLPGWEGLLELLKPLEWTVHVYPKVVRVFASKGHEPALHFYENYLLPKVRQDIEENRRLSVQLFEALIASMFRPEEFVSGVFLPWMQSEMSKTEGVILAHLMKKATLKARFAAVALALSLEEEFSVARSLVIESLLSKHYHMPEAALSRVIQYFLNFDKDCSAFFTNENRMPVIWFRNLLTFLEFYRNCVGPDVRTRLIKLCRRHEHPQITPEIRTLLSLIPTSAT